MMNLIKFLANHNDASECYLSLCRSNSLEKKIYGLAGLRMIGDKNYEKYKNILVSQKETILYGYGGCILSECMVMDVIVDMERKIMSIDIYGKNPINKGSAQQGDAPEPATGHNLETPNSNPSAR